MREVRWIASSRKDLRAMPEKVRKEFGDLLTVLQLGRAIAPPHAKALTGFDPAVIELIEAHEARREATRREEGGAR